MPSKRCFDRDKNKCEGKSEVVYKNYFIGQARLSFGPDLILCEKHLKERNGVK